MDDITNADQLSEGAEGTESLDPRISPEAIWGANQAREGRPASAMSPVEPATPAAPGGAKGAGFGTWYPAVWSPWDREGSADERPTEPGTTEAEAEPEPESFDLTPAAEAVQNGEAEIEEEVLEADEFALGAVVPDAMAGEPAPNPEPDIEDSNAETSAFTWTRPVRDHAVADAWVIAPGAPAGPDWSDEAASPEEDEDEDSFAAIAAEDGFASKQSNGSDDADADDADDADADDADVDDVDEDASAPAAIEDERLREIFDEEESLAAHTRATAPVPQERSVPGHFSSELSDQWVFTGKRFSGQKRSRTRESWTSTGGPEPTAPQSTESGAGSSRPRRRRREVPPPGGGHPTDEPWSASTRATSSAALVGFDPEPKAGPGPQVDMTPGLAPVESLIPERRRGRGRHRRQLGRRGSRPERSEPEARPDRQEPLGREAGAGGAGGVGASADLSGSLVMGSGSGMTMSSTVRVLAIALPLAAAAIAVLSYLR